MSLYIAVQLRGPPDDLLAEPGGVGAVPRVDADRLLLLRAEREAAAAEDGGEPAPILDPGQHRQVVQEDRRGILPLRYISISINIPLSCFNRVSKS